MMLISSTLDRKLLRDLWRLRGQAVAISLVIAAGLAAVMMSLATLDSLRASRDKFYADNGFTQVFAQLKRAPQSIAEQIREIPGVATVETRVTAGITLQMPDFHDPVRGYVLSMPQGLNRLHLSGGRLPLPDREDEIVIGEAFAQAHSLEPGDRLSMTLYGKRINPRIVGIALSPEFIYQLGPGELMPDFKRFSIGWMEREPLARALDLDGAFNNVVMTLSPGASEPFVIEQLDILLRRWGGTRAYGRDQQQSHRFLSEEFKQLSHMGQMFSFIFLGISAFLLNIVIGRLVDTQRPQIAILKAFGYSNAQVGWHYARQVIAIILLGCVLGLAAGAWLGDGLAGLYGEYYRLPEMIFRMSPRMALAAVVITAIAALLGAAGAVWRGVRLPPAEAMRPEPPVRYRVTIMERIGLQKLLSPTTRMILRQIERQPVRTLMTVTGVALATGIMVSGLFFPDSMNLIVDNEFRRASRENLAVSFIENTERRALHELSAIPGVRLAEPHRTVSIELSNGNILRRTALQGLEPGPELHRILDDRFEPVELPEAGLVVSEVLADVLGLHPGDLAQVEVLDGRQNKHLVEVTGVIQQWVGMSAYMNIDALNRLLGDGDVISGAFMAVPEHLEASVLEQLEDRPRVAGTRSQRGTVRAWEQSFQEVLLTFVTFLGAMAGAITLGIVYNAARITLSERARELASLRVLGFTRAEISRILLGELAILVIIAIPIGFGVGWWLALQWAAQAPKELFVVPVVITPKTLALSASVVLGAALLTGLIVRRRIDHLDMIGALKTNE